MPHHCCVFTDPVSRPERSLPVCGGRSVLLVANVRESNEHERVAGFQRRSDWLLVDKGAGICRERGSDCPARALRGAVQRGFCPAVRRTCFALYFTWKKKKLFCLLEQTCGSSTAVLFSSHRRVSRQIEFSTTRERHPTRYAHCTSFDNFY